MIHITRDRQAPKAHDTTVTIECDRCGRDSRHVTLAESNDPGSLDAAAGCATAMARLWDHWHVAGRKHYCPTCAPRIKHKEPRR